MKTYLIFVIQGYDLEAPDGRLVNITTLDLIDKTYESALNRAKKIITKKFYRLSMVLEKYV